MFEGDDEAKYVKCTVYVQAPVLYAKKGGVSGTGYYNVENHTHEFTVGTGQDAGKIFIEKADYSGASHSFNIADTQFYKDAVSAASVASASRLTTTASSVADRDYVIDFSSDLYASSGWRLGRLSVNNESGTVLKKILVQIPDQLATVSMSGAQGSATNVGVITGTASGDGISGGTGTYEIYLSAAENSASTIKMQVIHGSGSSQVVLAERSVTPTAAINAGAETAYVSAIVPGTASTPTYDSSEQKWYSDVPELIILLTER